MKIIRCQRCNLHLGEIQKAKLRKGIIYLCPKCYNNIVETQNEMNRIYQDNPLMDTFSKIFK
jgi:hypothetical protein